MFLNYALTFKQIEMLNKIAFTISDEKIKTSVLLSIKSILVIYFVDYYSLILFF